MTSDITDRIIHEGEILIDILEPFLGYCYCGDMVGKLVFDMLLYVTTTSDDPRQDDDDPWGEPALPPIIKNSILYRIPPLYGVQPTE